VYSRTLRRTLAQARRRARLRPSTRSSYRETPRLHVLPTCGRMNLRALTPTHVPHSHTRTNTACEQSCRWTGYALGPDHPQHPAHNAQRGHARGVDRTECGDGGAAAHGRARRVMEILGHSQLAMTTDLYSHVMPTALREAADAMGCLRPPELNRVAVSVAVNRPCARIVRPPPDKEKSLTR
jgi:hypothetical protein